MAQVLPVLGTVASVFGAYSQYKAGKDAEEAIEEETEENLRRQAAEDRATAAETRARIAASGVQTTGSSALYLSEMEKEQGRQSRWLKKAGDARAKSARASGTTGAIGSLSKIPGYWT